MKRFLGFLEKIEKSDKIIPKLLLSHVRQDTRSITGSNLRTILLLTEKVSVEHLSISDLQSLKYQPSPDEWKMKLLYELLTIREMNLSLENLDELEINEIINDLCCN